MTAVPSDITAEEAGGSYRQWATEGLRASSKNADPVANSRFSLFHENVFKGKGYWTMV